MIALITNLYNITKLEDSGKLNSRFTELYLLKLSYFVTFITRCIDRCRLAKYI